MYNYRWKFHLHSANLCATAATCIMSWSSPTLPLITKKGAAKIYVTEEEGSWISSIPALGACLGPFVSGALVDCLGRKRTLLATMLLFVVTWAMIYFSTDISVVLCARFIGGLGVGCVYATLPMFLAEISPVSNPIFCYSVFFFFFKENLFFFCTEKFDLLSRKTLEKLFAHF